MPDRGRRPRRARPWPDPAPDQTVTDTLDNLRSLLADPGLSIALGSTFELLRDHDDRERPDEQLLSYDELDTADECTAAAGHAVIAYALHRAAGQEAMRRAVVAVWRAERGGDGSAEEDR